MTACEHQVGDIVSLERLYGAPQGPFYIKEIDYIHPHYRSFIEAAPFAVLATSGPEGLDASPRGDPAGFIVVEDRKTLLIPDRRGNNRVPEISFDSAPDFLKLPSGMNFGEVPGVAVKSKGQRLGELIGAPNSICITLGPIE